MIKSDSALYRLPVTNFRPLHEVKLLESKMKGITYKKKLDAILLKYENSK